MTTTSTTIITPTVAIVFVAIGAIFQITNLLTGLEASVYFIFAIASWIFGNILMKMLDTQTDLGQVWHFAYVNTKWLFENRTTVGDFLIALGYTMWMTLTYFISFFGLFSFLAEVVKWTAH